MRTRAKLMIVVAAAALSASCTSKKLSTQYGFTESQWLGGEEVSAEVLNIGRENYVHYCYACHGMDGKGDGPASKGLRPPPRDFRQGLYKFGGVKDGLPWDDDFVRIIRGGLWGTAMLPWDITDDELLPIIKYIKTFSDVWVDPDGEYGNQIPVDKDPWGSKLHAARARGAKIYHGLATCQQCHAAYLTREEIYQASVEVGSGKIEFKPNMYLPETKESDYTIVVGYKVVPTAQMFQMALDGADASELEIKKKMKFMPPEFLYNPVRSGETVGDVFRTIAAGIPGTAMPAWYGSLDDKDLWAMAHYVKWLIDIKDTPEASALRARLANQPAEFVRPPAPVPGEPKPGDPKPADGAARPDGPDGPDGAAPAAAPADGAAPAAAPADGAAPATAPAEGAAPAAVPANP